MSIKEKHLITPDLFHSVVQALDGYIAIIDNDYRLISFNKSFADEFLSLYGIEVAEGQCLKDYFSKYPDEFDKIKGLLDLASNHKSLESILNLGISNYQSYHVKLKPVYKNKRVVVITFNASKPESKRNNHSKRSAKKFLKASRELYDSEKPHKIIASLLENMPTGLLFADAPDGKIKMASRKVLEWLNIRPEEILGKKENFQHWNITKYDKSEISESPLQQVLLSGKIIKDEEFVIQTETGKNRIISVEASPVFDEEKKLIGAISTWRDISKRVASEKEMRNTYKFPAENPNPIIRINEDGKILYVNLSGRKINGSIDFKVGKIISEPLKTLCAEAFSCNSQKITEISSGTKIYSFVIVPLKDSGYINLYGNDITERKKAEKELVSIKNDLSRAQQVGLIGSWRYSPTNDSLSFSDENYRIFDIPKNTLVTFGLFLSKIHPDDRKLVEKEWKAALTGNSIDIEHRIVVKQKIKWIHQKGTFGLAMKGIITEGFGTSQDITDRKLLEKELSQGKLLEQIFDQVSAGIALLDGPDFRYSRVNPWYATFTRGKGDIIGKTITEVWPEIADVIKPLLEQVYYTGEPFHATDMQFTLLRDRGKEEAYFTFSFLPFYSEQNKITGILLLAVENTESVLARKKIEESEERFRTLADNISQLAWMADETGWIFWYNKRWFDYTGTNLKEMKGWGWQKVHHPDFVNKATAKFKNAIDNGHFWEDIFPLRNKDGEFGWFLSRALPIKDANGKIIRWFGTNTDITKNIHLEKQLRSERELLQTMIETIPAMITLYIPETMEIKLNKAFEHITGWTNQDAKENNIMELAYPDPDYRKEVMDFMKSPSSEFKDIKMRTKYGTTIETSWANVVIHDKRQVGIGIDISERKRMEQKILSSNQQLQKFSELLENLLYMAAHDLRSPISNMHLIMDLIKEETNKDIKLQYLSGFDKMISRLEKVIEGLTEFIISQQNKSVSIGQIDLEEFLKEIIIEFENELKACNGSIQYDLKDVTGIYYEKAFLESILKNLVTNAIKYRDENKDLLINIKVRKYNGFVLLSVDDNGIGIDLEKAGNNLFSPFKRFTNQATGTGIGLYIIKNFIEKNDGYIEVKSKLGEGTTFNCFLKEYN